MKWICGLCLSDLGPKATYFGVPAWVCPLTKLSPWDTCAIHNLFVGMFGEPVKYPLNKIPLSNQSMFLQSCGTYPCSIAVNTFLTKVNPHTGLMNRRALTSTKTEVYSMISLSHLLPKLSSQINGKDVSAFHFQSHWFLLQLENEELGQARFSPAFKNSLQGSQLLYGLSPVPRGWRVGEWGGGQMFLESACHHRWGHLWATERSADDFMLR